MQQLFLLQLLVWYELQPLPDYMRWIQTGELHYLPIKSRQEIESGLWNEIPGLFLPSKVLDLCFKVIPHPPVAVRKLIALLAWVTEEKWCSMTTERKEFWKPLYKATNWRRPGRNIICTPTIPTQALKSCHKLRIPVSASLCNHDLHSSLDCWKEGRKDSSSCCYLHWRFVHYTRNWILNNQTISSQVKSDSTAPSWISCRKINKDELVIQVYLLKQTNSFDVQSWRTTAEWSD